MRPAPIPERVTETDLVAHGLRLWHEVSKLETKWDDIGIVEETDWESVSRVAATFAEVLRRWFGDNLNGVIHDIEAREADEEPEGRRSPFPDHCHQAREDGPHPSGPDHT